MTETMASPALVLAEIGEAKRTDRNRAIDLAIRALGAGLEHPLVLGLVADGLEEDGRLRDALALSHRATVVAPTQTDGWIEFGRRLRMLGRLDDALEAARTALSLAPESYIVQLEAAGAHLVLNNFAAAADHAERAGMLCSEAAEPLSTLAIIAARQNRFAAAREFAERAIVLSPGLPGAEIVLAKADMADGRAAFAVPRLERLAGRRGVSEGHRAEALTALGDALDAIKAPAGAFGAYAASNAIMGRIANAAGVGESRSALDHARELERYFRKADPTPWREPAGGGDGGQIAARHVFLVGFPRSGTTLLENALAGHPDIATLEESDALARCGGDLLADSARLQRLAQLTGEEARAAREIYWDRVKALAPEAASAKVFIDKMPVQTVALPLITKLFPRARILFARRDPRDVVFSCFRRLFGINTVMSQFLTLDGAARYYDQVMRLAVLYGEKLPLDLHTVRHEGLVADFDRELSRILDFFGLPWNAGVRDFQQRAIWSRTPSATQIARGLNAEGVGAWRRFQREMAPVLPLLEPWAARFGYTAAELPAAHNGGINLSGLLSSAAAAVLRADWQSAFEIADRAAVNGLVDPYFDRLLGTRAQQQGRLDEAIARFESVLDDKPADFAVLNALGLCLARNGRGVEGLARLDEAIALEPDFGPAHYSRGWTLEILGDVVGAREAYRRAIGIDPGDARALGNLAALGGRAGGWKEARDLAVRALALEPDQAVAATALACADADDGRLEDAADRLKGVIADGKRTRPHERAVACSHLGDVLDRQGRRSEAFLAYQTANDSFRSLYGARFEQPGVETAAKRASRLQSQFHRVEAETWNRPPGPPAGAIASPVFLLGFPRSGTTMLGQALARHPEVVTLDERETLADAVRRFMGSAEGLAQLATISEEEAVRYRRLYFERIGTMASRDARVFIDKLPMNTTALPVIKKLFPDSRIIFLRRDPRDVVFSCFRRQFVIDPTTVEFLSLRRSADLYVAMMSLFESYNSRLILNIQILKYETLVADFDSETRAICDRLGLDWSPVMRDFAAGAGTVATPSSAQLARGLNLEGVGHWRHYQPWLAPVLPTLQPWVERFGYPAD